MVPSIKPIWIQIALVLLTHLYKPASQLFTSSLLRCEPICLKLIGAREKSHHQTYHLLYWLDEHLVSHKTDHNRICVSIPKAANDTPGCLARIHDHTKGPKEN